MDLLFEHAVPAPDEAGSSFAMVAVERGLDRYPEGLAYRVPPSLGSLAEGQRVVVPLGRGDQATRGTVIARLGTLPEGLDPRRVKTVIRLADDRLPLGGELLELARWISTYYACPIGVTLASMLPAAVRREVGVVRRTFVDLATSPPAVSRLGPRQRAVLAMLEGLPAAERPIEMAELAARAGLATPAAIRAMVAKGLLVAESRREVRDTPLDGGLRPAGPPPELTADQARVVGEVGEAIGRGFSRHLLFGVTGSGKTEVYLRLVERCIAAGRRALLLVPEIALTPQTMGRLLARFPGTEVAILHSGMTAAQRHGQWTLAAEGRAKIVSGARSAVFAPLPDGELGLVIVDEEHDPSYKQDQAPRYHGRDVAIRRAQLAGCPVLLGSATPSLESWANATSRGLIRLHRLPTRAPGLEVPKVEVVDLAEEQRRSGNRRRLIGPTLAGAIEHCLGEGGQALLLLNRRGYANYIACADTRCGWIKTCSECDAGMVCHRPERQDRPGPEFLRCHHCLTQQRMPSACPQCGKGVVVFGLGTQRVEEELVARFPPLREEGSVRRVDSDSMESPGEFHRVLAAFGAGSIRVLLGTQMIAKGLDFPGVRLVGVVNADTAINLQDFRAAERTFQLVSQVSGRCGRGGGAGRAVVQTFQPQAPAIRLAALHRYEEFARLEIEDRCRFRLPPQRRLARVVVRDADEERARSMAAALRRGLESLPESGEVDLRGPSPCPIARLSGRYRFEVEWLAEQAGSIQHLLQRARREGLIRPGEQMAIDVDPVALL
jgi:primosomal protein N' (replication factor Y)